MDKVKTNSYKQKKVTNTQKEAYTGEFPLYFNNNSISKNITLCQQALLEDELSNTEFFPLCHLFTNL